MVENYSRKIMAQEDTIRTLNQRLDHSVSMGGADPDYEGLLRRENEGLKAENQLMRSKVSELSRQIDAVAVGKVMPSEALENECRRLRTELQEREREFLKQGDQMKQLIAEKDMIAAKQKNEWAEIYGNMKRETDGLKRDIRMLNKENERLVKQIETNRGSGAPISASRLSPEEIAKRLKKRELECQALWETLRDMYNSNRQTYDTRQMLEVLHIRALDVKARKKLGLGGTAVIPQARQR